MKKTIMLIAAMLCIGVASAQEMPNVKVQTKDGKTFNTSELVDGKTPFIISFWNTTCSPCIKELDAISEIYPDWEAEADFRMVIVSIDDSRSAARARAIVDGRGWTDFIALFDQNQDLKRALNVMLTPQVFVFDKDGNQVYAHTGYTPGNEDELFDQVLDLQ